MSLRHQLEHQQTIGWPAQTLMLPVAWYTNIAQDSEYGFPISGDRTAINRGALPRELRFCDEVNTEFRREL